MIPKNGSFQIVPVHCPPHSSTLEKAKLVGYSEKQILSSEILNPNTLNLIGEIALLFNATDKSYCPAYNLKRNSPDHIITPKDL